MYSILLISQDAGRSHWIWHLGCHISSSTWLPRERDWWRYCLLIGISSFTNQNCYWWIGKGDLTRSRLCILALWQVAVGFLFEILEYDFRFGLPILLWLKWFLLLMFKMKEDNFPYEMLIFYTFGGLFEFWILGIRIWWGNFWDLNIEV